MQTPARPMKMEMSLDVNFSSAHRLPYYDGPCSRPHGHNYVLRVTLEGTPEPRSGFIRDFDAVRKQVWELAVSRIDHRDLNTLLDNPTAENLIVWLWDVLKPHFAELKELRLWETPEYCVAYREA